VTKSEIIRILNRIEHRLPVAEWHSAGVPVWPFIRFEVYGTNFNPTFAAQGLEGGWRNKLWAVGRGLSAWALAVVRDVRASSRIAEPADVVFLATSIGRFPLLEGRRYNPLLAPYVALLTSLGRRCLTWEVAPSGHYNIPRHTPSVLIQPTWLFSRAVNAIRSHTQVQAHLPGHYAFLAMLEEEGLRTRYADIRSIRRDAEFVRTLSGRFQRWLTRIDPELGIVSDASLRDQAFILACRNLGVTTIELQHGVQGPLHPSYGSWEAVPPQGYRTKPSIYWCWDAPSADAINQWAARTGGAHQAIIGGDAWRQIWLEPANPVVKATDDLIQRAMAQKGAARHMLISLDTIGDLVPSRVLEMMRKAPPSWCFWLRLHPIDAVQRLPELERIVTDARIASMPPRWVAELPLHGILRHVDAHLTTAWSSVVLDASAFNVRSMACSPEASAVYPAEIASGMLRIVESSADMLSAMETMPRPEAIYTAQQAAPTCIAVMQDLLSTRRRNPT
jgi:hypothetical protein